jgi:hypothetical protein
MPSAETISRFLLLGLALLALVVLEFVWAGRHSSAIETWKREWAEKKKSERQRTRREERKRVREERKRASAERKRSKDEENRSNDADSES